MNSCCLTAYLCPSGKRSSLKEKIIRGSKIFPFRVDPFQKGDKAVLKELTPLKVYPFPLSM